MKTNTGHRAATSRASSTRMTSGSLSMAASDAREHVRMSQALGRALRPVESSAGRSTRQQSERLAHLAQAKLDGHAVRLVERAACLQGCDGVVPRLQRSRIWVQHAHHRERRVARARAQLADEMHAL